MTTPNDQGQYELGENLYYHRVEKIDEEGKAYLDWVPDFEMAKDLFLKPKPVHWATNPKIKRTVIAVGFGSYHIMVVARDPGQFHAKLYTSGLNRFGQLGHGDLTTRHELTLVRFQHCTRH